VTLLNSGTSAPHSPVDHPLEVQVLHAAQHVPANDGTKRTRRMNGSARPPKHGHEEEGEDAVDRPSDAPEVGSCEVGWQRVVVLLLRHYGAQLHVVLHQLRGTTWGEGWGGG